MNNLPETSISEVLIAETSPENEQKESRKSPEKENPVLVEILESPDFVLHNDSGHESASSTTPDSPPTPGEERPPTPAEGLQKDVATKNAEVTATAAAPLAETTVYRIRIQTPGTEPIDVQIGDTDIIQELYHMLLERDSTCHRTCFRLYYENNALDHFTEIRNIPNIKDQAEFTVVEEPYNVREARVHVRHLRDLLRVLDISDAVNGVECASFSCLSNVTHSNADDQPNKRPSKVSEFRASELDCLPPEYLLPESKEVPLKPVLALPPDSITRLRALKSVGFSPFNPPPAHRKLKGDVLYLVVDTAEERRFHITCCTRGFYVNATVGDRFKPEPSPNHHNRVFHSLFDLFSDLSPNFKRTLVQILKARGEKQIFERLPTPYQVYSWIVPQIDNTADQIRADEFTQPHRMGLEDHMPGQIRDWNEELQTTHDMPQTTFAERMCRDRARFKVHSDFVAASVRGAMAIIDGSVHTINPMDEPHTHMYIWNNIFFSLGFDVKDHYKELGGDAAAHAATSADLNAVQAYATLDDPKLHTLGMTVIDFRGYRIAAQSIIPGILEREQEESVVYGSFDLGKTVVSCEAYEQLLENSSKQLKIAPHSVCDGKEEGKHVKLYTSFESKGIIGNDRRQYMLDLLRTFPPDPNFLEDAEVTEQAKAQGFPRKFKHKLVYLRQELVDNFVDTKIVDAAKELPPEEVQKIDIRFNPDCFSISVQHAPEEDLEAQKRLVAEAAEFLLIHQIPQFVSDCSHSSAPPLDGQSFTESLHGKGINIRYLGKVIEHIGNTPKFDYLAVMAKVELLCRSAKHVFNEYVRGVEGHCIAAAVAHFLNCLLASGKNLPPANDPSETDPLVTKKQSKKKRKAPNAANSNVAQPSHSQNQNSNNPLAKSTVWMRTTQETLWRQIADDSEQHFGLRIPCDSCDEFLEWSGGVRVAILRRFCIVTGVQLALKNYHFDPSRAKAPVPFSEADVQNLHPKVKHLHPRAQGAYNLYLNAILKMQQGLPRIGYELMAQAQSMMGSIYGPVHPDLALCYRLMSRMAFAVGDFADALAQQHKALVISERCNGIDHAETIIDYVNLAHFSFANLFIPSSLKLLYRARHLLLVAHGTDHPLLAQIDANIGVLLYSIQEYELALKFLENALRQYQNYDTNFCLKTALLYHVLARTYSCRGDFRVALQMEKETFNIYERLFGKDHEKTLLSGECLKHLTKQAVSFQKHMNNASAGGNSLSGNNSLVHLIPMNIQPPSVQNIIELLNGFNNFIFWKIQIKTE